MFSPTEIVYLRSQRLARLATVSAHGQPDADAVVFEFDGTAFFIGGYGLPHTRKYKNVAQGHRLVSLIIDDLASTEPWAPRGIKVHGHAAIVVRNGRFGAADYLAIRPTLSWSWGIDGAAIQAGRFSPKRIVWPALPADEREHDGGVA
jgi:pyridoxamine 5'-phosphate oxidase family protein